MPIYEYECSQCRFRFEMRQGFDDDPVDICPKCQGRARRLLQPVPIFFKGSGFYSTDHGRGWQGTSGKESEPAEKEAAQKEPAQAQKDNPGKDTASEE